MSEPGGFTQREGIQSKIGALEANVRLLRALRLFLWFLPLSLVLIVLASVTPSALRWYAGNLADPAGSRRLPWLGWEVPIDENGLLALALLGMLFRIGAWASFELTGMWSAQRLHALMVRGLGRARTTFFDENPSGRLINRLVTDYNEVRSTAIIFLGDLLNATTEVLSVAGLALIVSPWAAAAVVPLLGGFAYLQWMRSGILDRARSLSAVSVSRVLDRKTDLVEGREIFLLYGRSRRLLQRMTESYDAYVRSQALSAQLETWASFWMRILSEAFSAVVLAFLVVVLSRGSIDPTMAGVVISALFGVRGSINWLDFATSQVSRSTPHIRRVLEFVDLPTEEAEERAFPRALAAAAPASAPLAAGDVRFAAYTMSYRKDTPVILRDLDLTLPLGSKTALIGRTGSGKTSLMQALFRMVHVHSGDLLVGGRSALDADIHELRALFGVVPQSPYLFAGTLRSNLDRFGQLSEARLRAVLEEVGLAFGLEHPVQEGGQNLSVGERQLICLARVIATDRPFVLMDEPTSGMDPETDARIHRILRSALAGRTVLTIAHRRESLGSYDRIVEMSQGRIVWEGAPVELERRG